MTKESLLDGFLDEMSSLICTKQRKENPKVKERQGRIEARRKGLKEKADTLDTDL